MSVLHSIARAAIRQNRRGVAEQPTVVVLWGGCRPMPLPLLETETETERTLRIYWRNQIEDLFDEYAPTFEDSLVRKLGYTVPARALLPSGPS